MREFSSNTQQLMLLYIHQPGVLCVATFHRAMEICQYYRKKTEQAFLGPTISLKKLRNPALKHLFEAIPYLHFLPVNSKKICKIECQLL